MAEKKNYVKKDTFKKEGGFKKEDNFKKEGGFKKEGTFKKEGNFKKEGTFRNDGNFKKEGNFKKDGAFKKEGDFKKEGTFQKVEKRTKSKCPVYDKCGGCQYLDLPYEEQLAKKQTYISSVLKEFGKVEPIVGMKDPLYYRNKVHGVLHRKKDGTIESGIYDERSRTITSITNCFIENKKSREIIQSLLGLFQSFKYMIYSDKSGYGFLKDVIVRTSKDSGDVMVILVTTKLAFPSKNNFVKALVKLHPEVKTIIQNVNDKNNGSLFGDREEVIYGKGYLEDTLCGITFQITAKSHFSVNPAQVEKLYAKAMEFADVRSDETVLDVFCGAGTLALMACDKAKEVYGIDVNKDAIKEAKNNAKRNGIVNSFFYNNEIQAFLLDLVEKEISVDTVMMEPSKSGVIEETLRTILKLAPKKIIYVASGIDTLERDLRIVTAKKAYKVVSIAPFDSSPMTGKVECVVKLVQG